MEHYTQFDHFMRKIRVPIIIFAIVSGPVMIFTYAWGMRLLVDIVGIGWWLAICLCHAIV